MFSKFQTEWGQVSVIGFPIVKAACGNLEVANTLVGDTLLVAILIIDFFRNMKAGEDRTYQVLLRLTIRQIVPATAKQSQRKPFYAF